MRKSTKVVRYVMSEEELAALLEERPILSDEEAFKAEAADKDFSRFVSESAAETVAASGKIGSGPYGK